MSEEHSDSVKYLIDNEVMFLPFENRLYNIRSQTEVLIKKQASLCLLSLIHNYNNLITQNELLNFAWGAQHQSISFNTFYQCILSVRKGFAILGVKKQIITTVPRKGLVIYNNIPITRFENDVAVHMLPESTGAISAVITGNLPEKIPFSVSLKKSLLSFYYTYKWSFLIVFITFIISCIYLASIKADALYFSSYQKITNTTNKCTMFFNRDTRSHNRHEEFMARHPEYCPSERYVYVTAHEDAKNISVFICSELVGNSSRNACLSIYYPEVAEIDHAIF